MPSQDQFVAQSSRDMTFPHSRLAHSDHVDRFLQEASRPQALNVQLELGREPSKVEIAERFLEQSALGASAKLPRDIRGLIERFLAIQGNPDEGAAALRALAAEANMTAALTPALDQFESRTGFLEARGVDVKRVRFSTAFGRGFDYYTGLVFELTDPQRTGDPLVAGGRYDELLARLGATGTIPAVGFAIWIERLSDYGGAS